MPWNRDARTALALLAGVALTACGARAGEEGALLRGDQAWAAGDLEEALAEYRLALVGDAQNAAVVVRVAHAYAEQGRMDEAREFYRRAVQRDPAYADQAVADMVSLARRAEARRDRFEMAGAYQAAVEFRPGVSVPELALPLARHYSRSGEFGRALPFYQRALAAVPADSASEVLYETALAYEEVGDCRRALVFFEQHRDIVPPAQRGEVDWHIGNCAFQIARTHRAEDHLEEALRYIQATITLGEPKNLQAAAHFEKGEILAARGECDAAVEAFRMVRATDPAGAGPLVNRAQQRIDEIRFGRQGAEGAC